MVLRSLRLAAEYELSVYELWVEPFVGRRRLRVTTDFTLPFETASVLQAAVFEDRLIFYCRASENGLWLAQPLGAASQQLAQDSRKNGVPVLLCEGLEPSGGYRHWVVGWLQQGDSLVRSAQTA